MVVGDFGIVVWRCWSASPPPRRAGRVRVARERSRPGRRTTGLGGLVASYSPNAYVVDLDPGTRQVLIHDLVPNRASEEPV